MKETLEQNFRFLVQYVAVFYTAMCAILALVKAPVGEVYRPYRRAKWLLATAFGLMAVNLAAYCLLTDSDWSRHDYAIESVDITLFYLEYVFLSYAFLTLLNRRYVTRRRVVADFVLWAVTALLAFAAIGDVAAGTRDLLMLVALSLLLVFIVRFVYRFFVQYGISGHMLDDYFSCDMHRFMKWLSTSVLMLAVSWLLAVLTMFQGVYFNWLYQFYMVAMSLYIISSFINYVGIHASLSKAFEDGDEDVAYDGGVAADSGGMAAVGDCGASLPATDGAYIEKGGDGTAGGGSAADGGATPQCGLEANLRKWVDGKGYLGTQFNIEELAAVLGTTKSALSFYINDRHGMNFSAWMADLRIEEAKRMMSANADMRLEDIALAVGFSSLSYFSKVFSQHEGMAPTRWRRES